MQKRFIGTSLIKAWSRLNLTQLLEARVQLGVGTVLMNTNGLVMFVHLSFISRVDWTKVSFVWALVLLGWGFMYEVKLSKIL